MSGPAEAAAATERAWYVYGIVDPDAPAPALAGVEGDVALLYESGLAALVSRVPLSDYGEEPVRAKLEDPAWLEEKARAHEAVLSSALHTGAVLPFRFLTLYRDEHELRTFLRTSAAELHAALERIRGTVELGVKAFFAPTAMTPAGDSAVLRELDEEIERAPAGKAYLLRRRRDQIAAEEATRFRFESAYALHERLAAVAARAVSNPPQPRELSGRDEQMLLNAAYLVPAGDEQLPAALAELEEEYGPLGVTFELTGPWPAYNFVPREVAEP